MKLLLDTNAVSEYRHPQGDVRMKERLHDFGQDRVFLSVISIGEVARGVAKLDDGARRRELADWLAGLRSQFGERLIDIDADIAERWGAATVVAKTRGDTIGAPDGLIAATAQVRGLHVATRNIKHMLAAGASAYDPWTGQIHEPSP